MGTNTRRSDAPVIFTPTERARPERAKRLSMARAA
jgi:hypothetical protein